MPGYVEGFSGVCSQQRNLEYPSDSNIQSLAVVMHAFATAFKVKVGGAVSHQMPACCSFAVLLFREGRNHVIARVVSAESWGAWIQVMAGDAAELPCSIHNNIVHLPAVGWLPDPGRAAHSCSHVAESEVPQSLLELQSATQRTQGA